MADWEDINKVMEPTLQGTLDELLKLKNTTNQIIEGYYTSLNDLNDTVVAIDKEMSTANSSEQHELRQYKSSLLQVKTQLNDQIKESQNILKYVSNTILLFQKAIQLNTGDIF